MRVSCFAVSTWTVVSLGQVHEPRFSKKYLAKPRRGNVPSGGYSASLFLRATGVTREADTPLSLFNRSRSKIPRPG